ncbi:MAG: hypothetical protein WA631_09290 [Nitrososphaeraceae archaeon]
MKNIKIKTRTNRHLLEALKRLKNYVGMQLSLGISWIKQSIV